MYTYSINLAAKLLMNSWSQHSSFFKFLRMYTYSVKLEEFLIVHFSANPNA